MDTNIVAIAVLLWDENGVFAPKLVYGFTHAADNSDNQLGQVVLTPDTSWIGAFNRTIFVAEPLDVHSVGSTLLNYVTCTRSTNDPGNAPRTSPGTVQYPKDPSTGEPVVSQTVTITPMGAPVIGEGGFGLQPGKFEMLVTFFLSSALGGINPEDSGA